jgi:hypothetical protein
MSSTTKSRHQRGKDKKKGYGVLRAVLETAHQANGYSRNDLTVLSAQVDPYRLDTPAGHRDGEWAAEQLNRFFRGNKRTHWRGLHYAIVAHGKIRKPDGAIFRNTENDWLWLSGVAGKAARWLGYIPFERITDNRNADPIIHRKARVTPESWVSIGLDVTVPDIEDIEPTPGAAGFVPRQAFQFVIFGEKGSLEDAVLPRARYYEADLYLPTGEISDTLLYRIAQDAARDGRPLVVFTISDCDPAGHQMPVSIARKLQALRDFKFRGLRFEVVQIALTVSQVRELGLPSTPLKESEKRSDRWREAFGVEQTEIDALATLQPDTLREIIDRAFDPYFDRTLEQRVEEAEAEWMADAQVEMSNQIDDTVLTNLREQMEGRLEELRERIETINEQLRLVSDDITLPDIEVPEPDIEVETEKASLGQLGSGLDFRHPRFDQAQVVRRRGLNVPRVFKNPRHFFRSENMSTQSATQDFTAYLIAELGAAVLRARVVQADLEAVALALRGNLITAEQALVFLDERGALDFVGTAVPETEAQP